MSNPILVEVLRGSVVESRHRGAVAVVDADGSTVLALGDVDRPVFPRSAVKVLQALPLLETGAADRFRLTDAQLALACASHSGEPDHVAAAQAMLTQAKLDVTALRCGAHPPIHQPSATALYRAGAAPTALHNNCSGKHGGFLCLACALDAEPRGYIAPVPLVPLARKATIKSLRAFALADDAPAGDRRPEPTSAIAVSILARACDQGGS